MAKSTQPKSNKPQFNVWLVVSGSHGIGSKSYKKGDKFVTDADMNTFNTLPHAPKYKFIRAANPAEILQAQAEKGFHDGNPPPHVKMVEGAGPGFLNKPEGSDLEAQPESQVDAEQEAAETGEGTAEDVDLEGEEYEEEEETEDPSDSLEAMTVAELKSLAGDEEIDISGLHLKADIVQKIRDARAE